MARRSLTPRTGYVPRALDALAVPPQPRRMTRTIDDTTADATAAREEWQRWCWARELGMDPRVVDLLRLPPVPRGVARNRWVSSAAREK